MTGLRFVHSSLLAWRGKMLGMVTGKIKTTQAKNIAQFVVFLLLASNHSLVYCFGSSISSFYSAPEFWVNSKRFDGIALNHRAFNQKNDILPTKAMFEDVDCDTFATSGCITYKKVLSLILFVWTINFYIYKSILFSYLIPLISEPWWEENHTPFPDLETRIWRRAN